MVMKFVGRTENLKVSVVSVKPFGVSKHVKTLTSLISSTSSPDLNPLDLFEEISYIECPLLSQTVFEVLLNQFT
jgi:hypothetical protein